MNFIILGAGAIGCYVGGRLAAAGQAVTLVGRPRGIEPLAAHGLTVSDLDGFEAHLPPSRLRLAASLQGVPGTEPAIVLLCVKGGATIAAAREIAACCPPGTPVVSLQNGVDNMARISTAAPQMQVLAGMVPYNVVMPDANHVHRATSGRLQLARSEITARMLPIFEAAGLAVDLVDDMRPVQWGKLLLNLNNPVNALSGLPLREQLMNRDYRTVLAALQQEALAAMTRAGIKPARVTSAPPRALPWILRLPDWLFKRVAARMLRIDASARSSMWTDLQQGRSTEIDDLCGAVVRLAAAQGTPAPCNAALCRLLAQHQKGRHWSGPELRRAVGA